MILVAICPLPRYAQESCREALPGSYPMCFTSAESRIGGFVPPLEKAQLHTKNMQLESFREQASPKQASKRKIIAWDLYHRVSRSRNKTHWRLAPSLHNSAEDI